MSDGALAYLDTSAFLKLIAPERESVALERALRGWPQAVSSELLEIEARRVARRLGGGAPALIEAAVRRVSLVPIDGLVRARAAGANPPALRTLDAIHLATALVLGPAVGAFFAYDRALAHAASDAGLSVVGPR